MSECVNEFIDNLPTDYRTVIVLGGPEGLKNKELAEILYKSQNNTKNKASPRKRQTQRGP